MDSNYSLVQEQKDGPHFLHRNGKGLFCPHFNPSNTEVRVEIRGTVDREQVQVRKHPPIVCGTHCALFRADGQALVVIKQTCAPGAKEILIDQVTNAK